MDGRGETQDYEARISRRIERTQAQAGGRHLVENFAKYASRRSVTRFLVRNELFRRVMGTHGSIIECGVFAGQGLMSWVQLSSIYEPISGKTREVFGLDTFAGFPAVSENDSPAYSGGIHSEGDFQLGYDVHTELLDCLDIYDENRFLSSFPKAHLIKGDFSVTANDFFRNYPHVIPALLYLDFDLYEPTRVALETFLPRMPKGAIIAFDELNNPLWPGETIAALEVLDLRIHRLQRVSFDPNVSFIQLSDA